MLRSTLTCFALILCLVTGSATAGGPDDLRRAAEQGDADMQLELGVLYEYGYGLKENRIPALAWYVLAADQGNAQAAQRRDALKHRMSAAEIAQAERQAEVLRAVIAERKAVTPASPVPVQAPTPTPPGPMPVSAPASATPAAEPASATTPPSTEPASAPVAGAPPATGPTAPAP